MALAVSIPVVMLAASIWRQNGQGISREILAGLAVSLLVGFTAAFMAARIFVKPLNSVVEAALRVAQGDLTVRAQELSSKGELQALARNFNFMADSLERLERDRKDTVAAMSHELRTPLTILQGRLHAICDGVIEPTMVEHRRLLEHAEHLVRLVEDLHTMSLVEAGRLSLHLTRVDLGKFVHDLIPFYLHRAEGYNVEIEARTESIFIRADRDRLRQVFVNLIENSLHYAASGGMLEILVTQEDTVAVLQLSDRGSGLSDGEIEWVFDPFFRGDASASRSNKGSGLGLSIVQSLVIQHGGNISVSNRPEGGACFRITFPLAGNH